MEKLTAFLKKHYIKIIIILAAIFAVSLSYIFIPKGGEKTDDIVVVETKKPKKRAKNKETDKPKISEAPKEEDKPEATEESIEEAFEEEYEEDEEYVVYEDTQEIGEVSAEDKNEYCTIYVSCDSINNDITRLNPEKRSLVPPDGVLLQRTRVEIQDGDSVFDVLYRTLRENKIHMEFVKTPVYNSVYIEGIGNLYEFDCGELSGWQYRVNGEFPPYASSEYEVKNSDNIEFLYTCDLGRDIGGYFEK